MPIFLNIFFLIIKIAFLDHNERDIDGKIIGIIDTVSFPSDKTRDIDNIWCKEMCDKYNFNYDELINSGLCLTDLEQNNLYLNGLKEHIINNMKIESKFLHVLGYNKDTINKAIEDCK